MEEDRKPADLKLIIETGSGIWFQLYSVWQHYNLTRDGVYHLLMSVASCVSLTPPHVDTSHSSLLGFCQKAKFIYKANIKLF